MITLPVKGWVPYEQCGGPCDKSESKDEFCNKWFEAGQCSGLMT